MEINDRITSRVQQEYNTARAALWEQVDAGHLTADEAVAVLQTAHTFTGWAAVDCVQQAVHKAQAGAGDAQRG